MAKKGEKPPINPEELDGGDLRALLDAAAGKQSIEASSNTPEPAEPAPVERSSETNEQKETRPDKQLSEWLYLERAAQRIRQGLNALDAKKLTAEQMAQQADDLLVQLRHNYLSSGVVGEGVSPEAVAGLRESLLVVPDGKTPGQVKKEAFKVVRSALKEVQSSANLTKEDAARGLRLELPGKADIWARVQHELSEFEHRRARAGGKMSKKQALRQIQPVLRGLIWQLGRSYGDTEGAKVQTKKMMDTVANNAPGPEEVWVVAEEKVNFILGRLETGLFDSEQEAAVVKAVIAAERDDAASDEAFFSDARERVDWQAAYERKRARATKAEEPSSEEESVEATPAESDKSDEVAAKDEEIKMIEIEDMDQTAAAVYEQAFPRLLQAERFLEGRVLDGKEAEERQLDYVVPGASMQGFVAGKTKHRSDEDRLFTSSSGLRFGAIDGMGGEGGGDIAAEVIARHLARMDWPQEERLAMAQQELKQLAREGQVSTRSGACFGSVELLLDGGRLSAEIVHAGDVRVVIRGTGGSIRFASKDSSPVQQLVDSGVITQDQSYYHPERNYVSGVLTGSALPVSEEVDPLYSVAVGGLDDWVASQGGTLAEEVEQEMVAKVVEQAETDMDATESLGRTVIHLEEGDEILVFSDGYGDSFTDEELLKVLDDANGDMGALETAFLARLKRDESDVGFTNLAERERQGAFPDGYKKPPKDDDRSIIRFVVNDKSALEAHIRDVETRQESDWEEVEVVSEDLPDVQEEDTEAETEELSEKERYVAQWDDLIDELYATIGLIEADDEEAVPVERSAMVNALNQLVSRAVAMGRQVGMSSARLKDLQAAHVGEVDSDDALEEAAALVMARLQDAWPVAVDRMETLADEQAARAEAATTPKVELTPPASSTEQAPAETTPDAGTSTSPEGAGAAPTAQEQRAEILQEARRLAVAANEAPPARGDEGDSDGIPPAAVAAGVAGAALGLAAKRGSSQRSSGWSAPSGLSGDGPEAPVAGAFGRFALWKAGDLALRASRWATNVAGKLTFGATDGVFAWVQKQFSNLTWSWLNPWDVSRSDKKKNTDNLWRTQEEVLKAQGGDDKKKAS